MDRRKRTIRLVIVVAIAAAIAMAAWLTQPQRPPCKAGRVETRDTAGKVIRVQRTTCD